MDKTTAGLLGILLIELGVLFGVALTQQRIAGKLAALTEHNPEKS